MDVPESNGIGEWVRYLLSGVIGGALMLVGIMRAWSGISRRSEDALSLARTSHDRHNHTDGRVNDLERREAAAQARMESLVETADRVERKLDRLTERLGG